MIDLRCFTQYFTWVADKIPLGINLQLLPFVGLSGKLETELILRRNYRRPLLSWFIIFMFFYVTGQVYRRMVKAKSSGRGGGDPEFSYQKFRTHEAARASSTGGLLRITEEDESEDEQNELMDIERQ
jgi:hypothetical protein